MSYETTNPQPGNTSKERLISDDFSVCRTPGERQKLKKLFELFIEVDKNLRRGNHEEHKRN